MIPAPIIWAVVLVLAVAGLIWLCVAEHRDARRERDLDRMRRALARRDFEQRARRDRIDRTMRRRPERGALR